MLAEDKNTANKRIAKNTIFLSIRMLLVLCINLYTTRVVLSNIGVEDYGIYNVVCGFVMMFTFINTSLTNGIQRFYNFELGKNQGEKLGVIYSTSLVIQVFIVLIMILLTETLGLWYLNNKLVIPPDRLSAAQYIYQFSILSFVFVIVQAPFSSAVLAYEKMDFYALVSVFVTIMKLAVALCLPYWAGDRLKTYGLLLSLISIIEFFLYYIYARLKFQSLRFTRPKDLGLFKYMFSFSGWNMFGSFANIMKEQGINIILNLFFGPVVNAARGITNQINGGLQSFVSNFTIPVRPQVIKSYAANDIDRTKNLTYIVSKLSCFFLYLLSLPLVAEIHFILKLWLGDNIPEYTSSFVIINILISFVNNLNAAVSGIVHASGKMMLYQISTSFVSLLSLPMAYYLLKCGANPNWAIMMVFVTMVLVQIVSLYILKSIIEFSIFDYLRQVILPILLVIATTFCFPLIVNILITGGWIRLLINLGVSILTVSISVYTLGLNYEERVFCNNIIKKLIKK